MWPAETSSQHIAAVPLPVLLPTLRHRPRKPRSKPALNSPYTTSMAYLSSPWSAGHHLSALSTLASKLERLERQAELLDNLQEEEENQVCAVDIPKHSTLSPAAENPGSRGAQVCRGCPGLCGWA